MNNSSQQPYKGLTPYEERDKDNFFGRTEDIRILVDKIRARKLTFLFAASGVGKSSLLQAGVIPELKQPAHSFYAPLDVIYLRDWVEKPLETFKQKVLDYFQRDGRLTPDAHQQASVVLKDFLNFCTLLSSDPLVIILDQFEEFFYYQRYQEEFQPFIEQLSLAVHDSETTTVFVISMREDFALELNAFKEYMPTFLIENFYRLEKLTEVQAKEAIVAPVTRLGFEYQPELLAALCMDLSRREQAERMGAEAVSGKEELRVEPPHLQIVCMQLWAHPETQRTRVISLAIYVAQGRAEGLLNHYFRKTIQNFSRREKKLASRAFDLLVSRYGTKLARPLAELAATLRVQEWELGAVLKRLDEQRVLRQQDRQGKIWYELYHDVFAKHVYDWNKKYKQQQFILNSILGGVALVLGMMGVVGGYDGWVNYTQVHLRLSPQSGVSDVIEVYQGKLKSFDFWKQQGYLYETDYVRNQIEADKLFNRRPVGEIASLNQELVEQLPVLTRVAGYGELGEFGKAFCLAEARLSQEDGLWQIVDDLAVFRTVESFNWLKGHYSAKKISSSIDSYFVGIHPPLAILLEFVTDKKVEVRKFAASLLGKTGDKRAIKPLIDLSKDSDSYVRPSAAEALGQLGRVEAVTPLLALLKDSDSDVRYSTAYALGQLGSVDAVTPLLALLKDSDSDVCRSAANALGVLGSAAAVAPLLALLKDSDGQVRSSAATALGQLKSADAVLPLLALLKDSDRQVRNSAVQALEQLKSDMTLGRLKSADAVLPLLALLKDSDEQVRRYAVAALGQLKSAAAVSQLIERLKDSDLFVGSSAALALWQIGNTDAVPPLIAWFKNLNSDRVTLVLPKNLVLYNLRSSGVLKSDKTASLSLLIALLKNKDSDKEVRSSVATALGELESAEAVSPLLALLTDSDSDVRYSAITALGNLGSLEAVAALLTLLKNSDSSVRRSAASALGKLGSSKAVSPLLALLTDSDSSVRRSAASALGQLGSSEAVAPLVALIKDSESKVRFRAALALGQLGSSEAVAPLVALLKDSDSDVRRRAASALGQLGSLEALAPLLALLKDSDKNVRSNAAWALGQLGSSEAVTPLVTLLKDSDSDVRSRAAEALWYLGSPQGIEPSKVKEDELPPVAKKSIEPIKTNILQQIKASQISLVLPTLTQLYSRLNEDNIHVQRAVVAALGEILMADKKSTPLSTQAEVATPSTASNTSVTLPVTVKHKLSSESLPDYKANIQAKLASIINDSKAVFGLRKDALKAITVLGTEEVVQVILKSIAQEQIGEGQNYFVPVAFQALGDNGHPAALPFLQQQLQNLTARKQVWREKRDKNIGTTTVTTLACETSQPLPTTAEDSTWQQESWEYELGYAIARLDPRVGIDKLLWHPLTRVRWGAQEGLAKVATGKWVAKLIGQREEIKQAGIDSVDETIFVQAAYRAIDKMLRSLEETGTMEDLKALQGLKEVQDEAVKARVEWTVGVVGDKVGQ